MSLFWIYFFLFVDIKICEGKDTEFVLTGFLSSQNKNKKQIKKKIPKTKKKEKQTDKNILQIWKRRYI